MKFAAVAALAFAALANAQTRDDIPSCALPCLDASVKKNTQCSTTDYTCICKDFTAIQGDATTCVITNCGADVAVGKVLPATQALCTAVKNGGGASSAPASSAPASSAPASSAEASTAATTAAGTTAAATTAAGTTASAPASSAAASKASTTDCTTLVASATKSSNGTAAATTTAPVTAGAAGLAPLGGLALLALGALAL